MKKTAMQELIEWVSLHNHLDQHAVNLVMATAEQLLEKEKQQIIDAHGEGQADLLMPSVKEMSETNRNKIAENYYSTTFKNPAL